MARFLQRPLLSILDIKHIRPSALAGAKQTRPSSRGGTLISWIRAHEHIRALRWCRPLAPLARFDSGVTALPESPGPSRNDASREALQSHVPSRKNVPARQKRKCTWLGYLQLMQGGRVFLRGNGFATCRWRRGGRSFYCIERSPQSWIPSGSALSRSSGVCLEARIHRGEALTSISPPH